MKKSRILFLFLLLFFINNITVYTKEKETKDKDSKAQEEMIGLDFNNTDVKLVIKYLSELTGKNFVIDEAGVRGAITVISSSSQKIPKKDAAKVIESILELNGFSLVQSENLIKVVHKRRAKELDIETEIGNDPLKVSKEDKFITQIIPLTYAKAVEIQKVISTLVSKDSNMTIYTPINLLILSETSSNIHRLLKIIEYLDVKESEIKTSIITVKYASAKTIATHIAAVFSDPQAQQMQQMHRQAGIPVTSGEKRIVKAIPDDRTNNIIIMANEEDTKLIKEFVDSLDKDIDVGRDNIHVYYLENSDAEELAKVLSNVPLIERKSEPGKPISSMPQAGGQKPNIVADKFNNALIINEPAENYATIKKIIKQLDIPRSQVLVEAAIVEMSLDKSLQMGVDWRTLNKPTNGVVTGFGNSNFGLTAESGANAMSGGMSGFTVGLMKGWADEGKGIPNIGALLNIFKADSDFNILSTPQIVTIDNQEAEITVSDVIPFVTNARITDNNNTIKTYDYKDVGISLKIIPHINKQTKMVRMEITQEISKVLDANVTEAIRTSKRKAKTAVIVEDNKTIVIGGLIRNDKIMAESKIPLLGDIPFLGILFKRKKEVNSKTNLMIFITPHIIMNPKDFVKISDEKREQLDKFVEENNGIKTLKTNPVKRESFTVDSTSVKVNYMKQEPLIIDTTAIHYDSLIIE